MRLGLKVMARAQAGTFSSGNSSRDMHIMDDVEGEKYPWACVRAILPSFKLPATPGTSRLAFKQLSSSTASPSSILSI